MELNNLKICIVAVILELQNVCAYKPQTKPTPTPYHDWDYLMYSQRWPVTACAQWEESKPDNACALPPDRTAWTVHGIWPTKTGREGPLFCPSAVHFDPGQLAPLLADLRARWTNVEAGTKPYSFWKHEWDKHGTCAVTLPALDSIPNFFGQGLRWNAEYRLAEVLARAGITPGKAGYAPRRIFEAVRAVVRADPMVQCVVDRRTKESMISEIRICFNKTFGAVDCDRGGSAGGNCDAKKPVMYLDEVPGREAEYEMDYVDDALKRSYEEQLYYVKLYRVFKFLIWFTT